MDRHLVKEAEFIFIGKVTAVQYKSSTPSTANENPIPHTFVTCSIDEVLKGVAPASNSITLRLMGGAVVDNPSKVLTVEGVPEFQVDDSGMFFVRKNGEGICPLIGWRQGFFRIVDDVVSNYDGQELIVTSDPLYAARLHPLDIRDYGGLEKELSNSKRLIDGAVFSGLSDESRLVAQDPSNTELTKNFEASRLTFEYSLRNTEEINLANRLFPAMWRVMTRNVGQMVVYRDLGSLLVKRKQFSTPTLDQISLRTATKEMLTWDQDRLSVEKVMLLNRRILEDSYPNLITRSLDLTVLTGTMKILTVNTHTPIAGKEVKEISNQGVLVNGQQNVADPTPVGTRLIRDTLLSHLKTMVKELHSKEELSNPAEVQSADIQVPFQSAKLQAVKR